jgi:cellulose synthase/poly-beta-1,6-N-acetylglucosamine synthase-like glycosyltransferase
MGILKDGNIKRRKMTFFGNFFSFYRLLNIYEFIAVAHWTYVSCLIVLGCIGYVGYGKTKKDKVAYHDTKIIITSKASESVRNVIFECIDKNCALLANYEMFLLIDDGCDLYNELIQYIKKYPNISIVLTPKSFKCIAIAKGRAMEYFIREKVNNGNWYVFIDDDNHILDTKFLNEITYYAIHGYVMGNGQLIARKGRSNICYVADSLRYFDDIMIFRFATGLLKDCITGCHGEMFICDGKTLKDIGFDRKSITEDFSFGCEVSRRNLKVWQSETLISVQSPHSIGDFIKQRNRWYVGMKEDIKTAGYKVKIFHGIRLRDWELSIIGSWTLFPLFLIFDNIPVWLQLFDCIGLFYFLYVYTVGALSIKEKWLIFAMPLFSLMETYPPHLKRKNKFDFNVIQK